jgi:hypothetical protein
MMIFTLCSFDALKNEWTDKPGNSAQRSGDYRPLKRLRKRTRLAKNDMIHFNRWAIVPSNIEGDDTLFPIKTFGLNEKKAKKMKPIHARRGIVGAVIIILFLTVLEFPPPPGFETRPQDNVSRVWLMFFLLILITEIAVLPLIFKHPALGRKLAMVAAILNVLQVLADQTHLMQPEVAPLGYSLLEGAVASVSLVLFNLAWNFHPDKLKRDKEPVSEV